MTDNVLLQGGRFVLGDPEVPLTKLLGFGDAGGYLRSNGTAWERQVGVPWGDITSQPTTLSGTVNLTGNQTASGEKTWSSNAFFTGGWVNVQQYLDLTGPTYAEFWIQDQSAAAAEQWWGMGTKNGTGDFLLFAWADSPSTYRNILEVTRTGVALDTITYGNATNNPLHTFHGPVTQGGGTFKPNYVEQESRGDDYVGYWMRNLEQPATAQWWGFEVIEKQYRATGYTNSAPFNRNFLTVNQDDGLTDITYGNATDNPPHTFHGDVKIAAKASGETYHVLEMDGGMGWADYEVLAANNSKYGGGFTAKFAKGTLAAPEDVETGTEVGYFFWQAYKNGFYRNTNTILSEVTGYSGDTPLATVHITTGPGLPIASFKGVDRSTEFYGNVLVPSNLNVGGGTTGEKNFIAQNNNGQVEFLLNSAGTDAGIYRRSGTAGWMFRIDVATGTLQQGTVPWARLSDVPTTLSGTVNLTGNQTIAGTKTFSQNVLVDVDSTNSNIQFRTSGTVRGYVYVNTGNEIGFLNNAGAWSWRIDSAGQLLAGTVPWARLSDIPATLSGTVNLTGNQTVAGAKTFTTEIIASDVLSTEGSKILGGRYGSGVAATFGTSRSSANPVIGYAVWPSAATQDLFTSSVSVAFARSAFTAGADFVWRTAASQTVAIGSAVTMTERMRLSNTGVLTLLSTMELGHASDTTVARKAAGVVTIEGRPVQTSRVITQNASVTLGATHHNAVILHDNTTSYTYQLPSGTTVFEIGDGFQVHTSSTGTTIVSGSTNAQTINWFKGDGTAPATGNRTGGRGSVMTFIKVAASSWNCYGGGIS